MKKGFTLVELLSDISTYNSDDYEKCTITFIDKKEYVSLEGKGKFKDKYICNK